MLLLIFFTLNTGFEIHNMFQKANAFPYFRFSYIRSAQGLLKKPREAALGGFYTRRVNVINTRLRMNKKKKKCNIRFRVKMLLTQPPPPPSRTDILL